MFLWVCFSCLCRLSCCSYIPHSLSLIGFWSLVWCLVVDLCVWFHQLLDETFMMIVWCSTINTNPETDIGVLTRRSEKQNSHWLLPLFQSEMAILPPGIFKTRFVLELSSPILYSFLVLGLKTCTTTTQFLWQTSVTTGIKGMSHHCLVCKADQCSCFILWTSGKFID